MKRLTTAALFAACLVPATAVAPKAELPPTAYESMRAKAGYVLVLAIRDVGLGALKKGKRMATAPVTVEARVLSVIRGTGLKMGDSVTVRYTHARPLQPGWVGPAPLAILHRNTRVLAWLDRDAKGFVPAARGRSFELMR